MATSNGPHHHHPPNTDADYESRDHAMRDVAMLHGGGRGHGGHARGGHAHQQQSAHEDEGHHHGHSSQYQPEDNYRSHHESSDADHDEDKYQRAPVYENSYHNDQDEDDDIEPQNNYGGRPGHSDGSGSDRPSYESNYDHPHQLHHQPAAGHHHHDGEVEESRIRQTDRHYMPVANVPVNFV